MSAMKTNSSTLSAAIVTVSVGEEQIQGLVDAGESIAWTLTTADFESYISAARRPNISQQIRSSDICIAVVDFDKNLEQAVESVLYLQQIFAGKVSVVALSKSKDPEVMLVAMRNGCSEFLAKSFDQEDLIQLFERLAHQRTTLPLRNAMSGSVLSFFGAKGGVGSTTLAVHLALYLVQCHQKKTLLIDNHAELGHICVYLGIDGTRFHFTSW